MTKKELEQKVEELEKENSFLRNRISGLEAKLRTPVTPMKSLDLSYIVQQGVIPRNIVLKG